MVRVHHILVFPAIAVALRSHAIVNGNEECVDDYCQANGYWDKDCCSKPSVGSCSEGAVAKYRNNCGISRGTQKLCCVVTPQPTPSPPVPPGCDADACAQSIQDWARKCTWRQKCQACPECDNQHKLCGDFCESNTYTWVKKCTWDSQCAGCEICASQLTTTTPPTIALPPFVEEFTGLCIDGSGSGNACQCVADVRPRTLDQCKEMCASMLECTGIAYADSGSQANRCKVYATSLSPAYTVDNRGKQNQFQKVKCYSKTDAKKACTCTDPKASDRFTCNDQSSGACPRGDACLTSRKQYWEYPDTSDFSGICGSIPV